MSSAPPSESGATCVLRLLAHDAEHWTATRLNDYLRDNDEYRAATRNLLQLGGTIACQPTAITVTLVRQPHLAS